jgi:Ca2+/Na+ antiporter
LEKGRVAAPTRGSGSPVLSWSSPILGEFSVRKRLLLPVLVEFGLALLAIVVAAAIFTNAVEILGGRLNLGDGAVGSVLAAVGTALPETMIPIVAVLAAVLALS